MAHIGHATAFAIIKLAHNIKETHCSRKKKWSSGQKVQLTLKRWTSSILANCLPSETHDWKKLGATLMLIASEVMPVAEDSEELAMALKVPNRSTSRCCVTSGSDWRILQGRERGERNKCKLVHAHHHLHYRDWLILVQTGMCRHKQRRQERVWATINHNGVCVLFM